MTKVSRIDNGKSAGCFPDDTLAMALAKVSICLPPPRRSSIRVCSSKMVVVVLHVQLIDDKVDGVPTGFKILGKMSIPGEMDRPVSKFHGREVEVGLFFAFCSLLRVLSLSFWARAFGLVGAFECGTLSCVVFSCVLRWGLTVFLCWPCRPLF